MQTDAARPQGLPKQAPIEPCPAGSGPARLAARQRRSGSKRGKGCERGGRRDLRLIFPVLVLHLTHDYYINYLYREIWKASHNILCKSQSILLSVIGAHLSDGTFPVLDNLFPGSDLLQRYWFYTTTRVHRDSQSIHAFQDNLSITPIPTADAFHAVNIFMP